MWSLRRAYRRARYAGKREAVRGAIDAPAASGLPSPCRPLTDCSLEQLLRRKPRIVACGVGTRDAGWRCRSLRRAMPTRHRSAMRARLANARRGSVTISGDDDIADASPGAPPEVIAAAPDCADAARERAKLALDAGRLYDDARIGDPVVSRAAARGARRCRGQGRFAPRRCARSIWPAATKRWRTGRRHRRAAPRARDSGASRAPSAPPTIRRCALPVARGSAPTALWELNRNAERELRAGRCGEARRRRARQFREALRAAARTSRAPLQGIAAVESGADPPRRRSRRWRQRFRRRRALARNSQRRCVPAKTTIDDARAAHRRRSRQRAHRRPARRGRGRAHAQPTACTKHAAAGRHAAHRPRRAIAAAAELRERIDLATHYGLFRPGQAFTDALRSGARGPQMVVVPHGGFRMGAREGETDASRSERPLHYVRFDRGFAMSRTEITVGEFRRFMQPPATSRARCGAGIRSSTTNAAATLVRRSGVDWRARLRRPARAATTMPVLHVSARDAEAYARWLSQQTGERYRAAERGGVRIRRCAQAATGSLPWGDGAPPPQARATSPAMRRSFPERPTLAQRLRRLWRWLLGPGAGRPVSRRTHSAFTT